LLGPGGVTVVVQFPAILPKKIKELESCVPRMPKVRGPTCFDCEHGGKIELGTTGGRGCNLIKRLLVFKKRGNVYRRPQIVSSTDESLFTSCWMKGKLKRRVTGKRP